MSVALALGGIGGTLGAQTSASPEMDWKSESAAVSDQPVFSLEAAIEQALAQNFGLRVERLEASLSEESLISAQADFDPVLFANARYNQADQDAQQTTSDQRSYSAGVRKLIRTGAEVSATTALNRNDGTYFDDNQAAIVGGGLRESASISLSVTQPLLRGFGNAVTLAQLRRAESLDRATKLQLRATILDLLADVEEGYWLLADAEARLQFRATNRELAARLVDEVRERHALGLATQLEVLQAEASLAEREQEVIAAEQTVAERSDTLRSTLGGLDVGLSLDDHLRVLSIPDIARGEPAFEHVWRTTQAQNLDTAIQEELIAQRELDALLAKDSARPQLDVSLSAEYSGISEESGTDAYDRALDGDGQEWGVGVSFTYPFGSRAAKANYRRAEYRQKQAEWALFEIRQALLRDTRAAWRNLSVARRQVEAARTVVRLQEATFEQERSKFEEGLSTVREVLETQTDLDSARLGLLDAQYQAISAEIRLERLQGLLLERHGLSWPAVSPETAVLESR